MLRAELGAAIVLLTRLPAGPLLGAGVHPDLARCLWAFPLVGAAIGAVGAAGFALGAALGLPAPVAALWGLMATMLTTGALHEDGLADTADGFGGGRGPARKLEIMRDSRVGSFGALALLLSTGLRVAAVAGLATPGRVAPALIVAGALARGAIAVPVLLLPPARADGMAARLRHRSVARGLIGPALACGIAAALLPAASASASVGLGLVGALAVSCLARSQLGGYTGDVLGACAVLVECLVLSALAARWAS